MPSLEPNRQAAEAIERARFAREQWVAIRDSLSAGDVDVDREKMGNLIREQYRVLTEINERFDLKLPDLRL